MCRYYILKDDMLAYYVNDIQQRLSTQQDIGSWEVCILDVLHQHLAGLNWSRKSKERFTAFWLFKRPSPSRTRPTCVKCLAPKFSVVCQNRAMSESGVRLYISSVRTFLLVTQTPDSN